MKVQSHGLLRNWETGCRPTASEKPNSYIPKWLSSSKDSHSVGYPDSFLHTGISRMMETLLSRNQAFHLSPLPLPGLEDQTDPVSIPLETRIEPLRFLQDTV